MTTFAMTAVADAVAVAVAAMWTRPPWGLEWAPYGSPTEACRGPMEPYGALRGLGQYELAPPGA